LKIGKHKAQDKVEYYYQNKLKGEIPQRYSLWPDWFPHESWSNKRTILHLSALNDWRLTVFLNI